MITYLMLFTVSMLLVLILRVNTEKSYLGKIVIVFFPLFLYGALRCDDLDYFKYEDFHDTAYNNPFFNTINERFEYGYSFLNYVLPEFWQVIVVQALVLVISYCFVVYKYVDSKYLWVFVLLLFLSGEKTIFFFVAIRNTFALAALLFALPLIKERRLPPFVGLAIIASLFHTSALIFFPLAYVIGRPTPMKKIELWAWIITIIILLITPIETFIEQTGFLISGNELEKYAAYIQQSHENGFLQKMASVIFAGLILYDLRVKAEEDDELKSMLGRLALVFFIFPLLGTLNMRGTYFFCVIAMLYAVYIFRGFNNQPLYKTIFFILLIAYSSYALFVVEASSVYSNFETYKSLIDIK